MNYAKSVCCPNQCDSVSGAPSRKVKGHRFKSLSGLMPGLRPVPGQDTCKRQLIDVSPTHRCFPRSLSPSLPLSLRINK